MDSLADTQDLRSHDRARERRCVMKEYYELDHDECIKAINDILSKISDLWIVRHIYRFAVNMTEEE